MTDDMRDLFKKALPTTLPPTAWNSDDLEKHARRSIRNRRFGFAGGALAAVVAAAIAVPLAVPQEPVTKETPAAPNEEQAKEFPLPKLDDDVGYTWEPAGKSGHTAATKELTKAFSKYLASYEGLQVDYLDGELTKFDPGRMTELERQEFQLSANDKGVEPNPVEDDSGEVYKAPVYTTAEKGYLRFDGAKASEGIRLRVHAPGTFVEGRPEKPIPHPGPDVMTSGIGPSPMDVEYLADNCDGFSWKDDNGNSGEANFECATTSVDEGTVLMTERADTYENGNKLVSRTAVLYRDNGAAVTVEDQPSIQKPSPSGVATLPVKELMAMARAMPEVTVE